MTKNENQKEPNNTGPEQVISSIREGEFNGAILGFEENELGPNVYADGFGPNGKEMLELLGGFVSKGLGKSGGERAPPAGPRRKGGTHRSLTTNSNQEKVVKKLEESLKNVDKKDSRTGFFWAKKSDIGFRIGLEGHHDDPSNLLSTLKAGLRMQAKQNPNRDAFEKEEAKGKNGKILDFDDVVGMEEVKEAFKEMVIRPILYPEIHDEYKVSSGGGVLLYGPPGCGKTYIARAAAGMLDAEFYHIQLSDLLTKWFGETERKIRELFKQVKEEEKTSIVFLDEIDSLAPKRDNATGPMREALGQILSELDGFDKLENVMIMGATNHPWNVDSAITRPGRIDRTLFVSPPDFEDRKELFKYYTEDRPVENLDYEQMSEETKKFSCADIEYACEMALKNPLKETCDLAENGQKNKLKKAGLEDFEWAIEQQSPSIGRWAETVKQRLKNGKIQESYPELEEFINEFYDSKSGGMEHYG